MKPYSEYLNRDKQVEVSTSTWLEELSYYWSRLKPIPRRILRRIKNVLKWLPTIIKDEHFDQYFLYAIIDKKIQLMIESGYYDLYPERLKQMQKAREVLKIIKEEIDPVEEEQKAYDLKYGELHAWSTKAEIINGEQLYDLHFTRENITEENLKQAEEEQLAIYKLQAIRISQAYNKFGKILAKKSQDWWD